MSFCNIGDPGNKALTTIHLHYSTSACMVLQNDIDSNGTEGHSLTRSYSHYLVKHRNVGEDVQLATSFSVPGQPGQ